MKEFLNESNNIKKCPLRTVIKWNRRATEEELKFGGF